METDGPIDGKRWSSLHQEKPGVGMDGISYIFRVILGNFLDFPFRPIVQPPF